MRFVFVNVYAELTNVSVCEYHLAITVCRKLFCSYYGLKRLVKLAYSQHIIKYMIPQIGRLCILTALLQIYSSVRKEKLTTTTKNSRIELILIYVTPFWSSFHFRKHNANVLTHKLASTFSVIVSVCKLLSQHGAHGTHI